MKKIFISLLALSLSIIVFAQSKGTPDNLLVKTDANNYLLAAGYVQTLPISQPTQFANTRLSTDANGYLQVVITGGTISGSLTVTSLTTTGLASLTTPAESWIGPSSTTGVYFKSGNVGIGTTGPLAKTHIYTNTDSNSQLLRIENRAVTTGLSPTAEIVFYNSFLGSGGSGTGNTARIYSTTDANSYSGARLTLASPTGAGTWTDVLSIKGGTVGIGTTAPAALLSVGGNGSASYTADITGTLHASSTITGVRYLSNTAAPGLSACGTGTIDSNSTDIGGKVTATGATACTVTFTVAYPTAAWCVITDDTTIGNGLISAQSASAFTVSSLTSGDVFQYNCNGK